MPNKIMLLVDGDILAYRMVTAPEFLEEVHNEDDEWWEVLKTADAKDEFRSRVAELQKRTKAEQTLIAFGSKSNFRKKLYPDYKANRKGKKPLGYWAFVEWCRTEFDCVSIDKLEADDVLGIYHTSPELRKGFDTVLASADKDMRTLPGMLLNPDDEAMEIVQITEAEAITSWMQQSLVGDATDNYRGCPGVGAVGAGKTVLPDVVKCLVEKDGPEAAAATVFETMVLPEFVKKGIERKEALTQVRLARILRRGDFDITDPDAEVMLWDPSGGKTRVRSSKARTKRRRRLIH